MTNTALPIHTIRREITALKTLVRIMRATGATQDEINDRETELASMYVALSDHPEA